MALHYAASTVQTAAAAVVALHLWNDLQHPFKGDSKLQQLLAGIDACGICGSRAPKFIVDSNFVCGMVERFLAKYPVFRDEWFDPWNRGGDKSVILLRGVAMVCLHKRHLPNETCFSYKYRTRCLHHLVGDRFALQTCWYP